MIKHGYTIHVISRRDHTDEKFDYTLNYEELDLRKHPELYTVGRGAGRADGGTLQERNSALLAF